MVCKIDSISLSYLSIIDEGAIGAEISESVSISLFWDGAMLAAESFIIDADDAFWISADEHFWLSEGESG